jgi:N-acetylmuramoyl-L-alanine amidase
MVCAIAVAVLVLARDTLAADSKEDCLGNLVPAIDIGHHMSGPGTRDVFGRPELLYNSELAENVAASLTELGFRRLVMINRSLDVTNLRSRPQKALCEGAGVFISIHHDDVNRSKKTSSQIDGREISFNDEIGGYTIYLSSKNSAYNTSFKVAQSISGHLITLGVSSAVEHRAYLADGRRRLLDSELNIWDYRELAVLKYSSIPAILIEAGFLSNRQDVARLRDESFRRKISDAIAHGVLSSCMSNQLMVEPTGAVKLAQARQCGPK